MKSTPNFGAVVADLTRSGFAATDLLPLIPPGATLSENSHVQPFQIGKIPGRYFGGKWSGLTGAWASVGMSERDVDRAKTWPTQNVGLRGGSYPGIDIDTDSKAAFALVERLIVARFGDTAPVRYRGDAPRALYSFRLDPSSDPVRKHRIEWKDADGRAHAVEVLGLGQQYAIAGIHPTGVAYEWRERPDGSVGDLAAVTANGLPKLSVDDVMDFMNEVKAAIEASGGEVGKIMVPRYGWDGDSRAVDLNNAEPILENDIAMEALNSIPNTVESMPSREQFVAVLASFKQAVGRNAEGLRGDALVWATRDGWADEEYFDKVWESLTSSRVPFDHLISMARKYGWRGDAALDFKDLGQDNGEVEKKIQRAEQEDPLLKLATKLAYVDTEQVFIVKGNGNMYSPEALNRAPHLGALIEAPGTTGKQSPANRLCAPNTTMQIVKGVVYLPGEQQITQWEQSGRSDTYYNRWHARAFPRFDNVTDADVKPWLDHVAYLVPDKKEREELLDFFAHLLQKRGTKIRWAPLLIGKQGTGKDLMIKPIVSYLAHNARDIKPEQLTSRFNDFLESELLVVQELKRSTTQANGTYNRIKTLIAGTAEDVNYIEKKYQTPYAVPNVVNSIFFSNHVDAMEIDADDRRFFIILSEAEKRDPSYYQRLAVDFYQNNSGWLKVASWLLKRDIEDFNASQPPMQTEGKALLIDSQRTPVARAIEEAVTTGAYKDRKAIRAEEIVNRASSEFSFMPGVQRHEVHGAQVVNELRNLGWRNHGNVKIDGKVLRFWTRPGANPSNADIRAELDTAQSEIDF
ncbi:DUF5906 domain-containing protein [Rhizobium favelukesii]|uniref:Conserved protein n=1 Tax=Rhizobium favelukesii TaxID=348824 RepID=W6RAN1_9HYPH|nr:DUF5906 domain-containing protein [Rhizobium favelukesii]MCS0459283.1 bifunctional DNA primase/polymerase [Rhizobium favelukesii]CDM57415.1 putative conserved protein [Rhizobium favelukesii]